MKTSIKTGLAALLLLFTISCKKENSIVQGSSIIGESSMQELVTNIDESGIYASVKVGKLIGMLRNLSVSHYRNGDSIPEIKDYAAWQASTIGAWCYYNNDPANDSIYGKLYNWYAVNDPRGLAPKGWHVPSDEEWTTLSNYVGGEPLAGGRMKSTGTIEAGTGLWYSPNKAATNKSGFTGLPGGTRYYYGTFYGVGQEGSWWSSSENIYHNGAMIRRLYFDFSGLYRLGYYKQMGFSVRCLKD